VVGSRCTLILFERVIVATNDLTHAPPKKTKKGAACCSLSNLSYFLLQHTLRRGATVPGVNSATATRKTGSSQQRCKVSCVGNASWLWPLVAVTRQR
jgi:hypothetical protein